MNLTTIRLNKVEEIDLNEKVISKSKQFQFIISDKYSQDVVYMERLPKNAEDVLMFVHRNFSHDDPGESILESALEDGRDIIVCGERVNSDRVAAILEGEVAS